MGVLPGVSPPSCILYRIVNHHPLFPMHIKILTQISMTDIMHLKLFPHRANNKYTCTIIQTLPGDHPPNSYPQYRIKINYQFLKVTLSFPINRKGSVAAVLPPFTKSLILKDLMHLIHVSKKPAFILHSCKTLFTIVFL